MFLTHLQLPLSDVPSSTSTEDSRSLASYWKEFLLPGRISSVNRMVCWSKFESSPIWTPLETDPKQKNDFFDFLVSTPCLRWGISSQLGQRQGTVVAGFLVESLQNQAHRDGARGKQKEYREIWWNLGLVESPKSVFPCLEIQQLNLCMVSGAKTSVIPS